MNKILTSLNRKYRKFKTRRDILSSQQENSGVVNIHTIDTKNAGDYYCAPHHYFKELSDTALDIFDYKRLGGKADAFVNRINENAIIVGGGGLLNRGGFKFQMKIFEQLLQKGKKTVLWGVGHNIKYKKSFGKPVNYNVDVNNFGIAGTRDISCPGDFVPCVSCLHEIFDKNFETTRDIGIVFHKDTIKNKDVTNKFENYDTLSNSHDFESIINFIGTSETILTDSYHVMYWSMLLNKNIAIVPNSSKFYDFKHKPVFTDFQNPIFDVKNANDFSGLLEECREINLKFSEKVFDYLNL